MPGPILGVQCSCAPREATSEVARGEEGELLAKVTRSHQEGFVDPGTFLGLLRWTGSRFPQGCPHADAQIMQICSITRPGELRFQRN